MSACGFTSSKFQFIRPWRWAGVQRTNCFSQWFLRLAQEKPTARMVNLNKTKIFTSAFKFRAKYSQIAWLCLSAKS